MENNLIGNLNIDFDFHIHTMPGSKDSKQSVEDMMKTAKGAGITTVAITDHNSVLSLNEGISLAKKYDMTFVSGIEMSVYLNGFSENKNLNGAIVHILGLGISPDENIFEKLSSDFTARVNLWMKQIIKAAENHFNYKSNALNVWQLREVLLAHKFFNVRKEAKEWTRTFNDGTVGELIPFYMKEAIDIIHKMGGIAVLAHPNRGERHLRFNEKEVQEIVGNLVPLGLDGLEIYHKDVVVEENIFNLLQTLSEKYSLLTSLGSDRHFAFDHYGEKYFAHKDFLDNQNCKNIDFNSIKNKILESCHI